MLSGMVRFAKASVGANTGALTAIAVCSEHLLRQERQLSPLRLAGDGRSCLPCALHVWVCTLMP